MAAVISTGANPKLLTPGLRGTFGQEYKVYMPEYSQIFKVLPSDRHYEEEVGLTTMGLAPLKNEGSSIQYDTMKQGYPKRYTHQTFALGFIVTREELEDVLYPKVAPDRTRCLARSMQLSKEYDCMNHLNRAFSSSYLGGDGKSLCNTAHPIEGGTFSNKPTTDLDLSENALEQALTDIDGFVDSRNNPILVKARKLIIHRSNRWNAERILGNPLKPGTADRDINAMYQMGALPEGFMVSHFQIDSDAWYVLTDCEKGLQFFQRVAPRFEDDNDFDTKNGKFSGYERYSSGWTDPRCIYGSAGA